MKKLLLIIAFTVLAPNIFQMVLDDITYTMYRTPEDITVYGTDHTCFVWTAATNLSEPCYVGNVTITILN